MGRRHGGGRSGGLARRGSRTASIAVLAALLPVAAPVQASASSLEPALRFVQQYPSQDVAVLDRGVVWADGTTIVYQGFGSVRRTLGGVESPEPAIASSGTALVLAASVREGFAGAIPPRRLAPIQETWDEVKLGSCNDWSPLIPGRGEPGKFVLAGEKLIDPGTCDETPTAEHTGIQPLFVRGVRAGRWRVLRWVESEALPTLAAEGNLLAVGTQTPSGTMRVLVLNLANAHVVAHFGAPAGYLAFASPRRLVLTSVSVARAASEALKPERRFSYRASLYSLRGVRLADLGTFTRPPLVSHMHLLTEESLEGQSTLVVRSIPAGPSRRLVAFDEPLRTLQADAFRWPAIAAIESTTTPLLPSEVTCTSGAYHPPGAAFLAIFDLDRPEPFIPAPPPAPPPPSRPANCPPHVTNY